MIKEIIFDCFGVLTQDGWSVFVKKYSTEDTIDELRGLNTRVDMGLIGFDEYISSVCLITGATKRELLKLTVKSYYPDHEVFALIEKLKKTYKIGLISNISNPIETYLPTAQMDLFDEETLSYQVGVTKPDKEIFEIHLSKTGSKPEEAVFIDDREANAEGAKNAGLHGIWYKNISQLKEELKKLGVKV